MSVSASSELALIRSSRVARRAWVSLMAVRGRLVVVGRLAVAAQPAAQSATAATKIEMRARIVRVRTTLTHPLFRADP